MQTLTRPQEEAKKRTSLPSRSKRRRFSPLMLIGISVTLIIALAAGAFVVLRPQTASNAAAAPNPNCSLIMPNDPLSAQGLATPYQLVATNPKNGACHEANPDQSAFVQATIFDPATNKVMNYNPLVIDRGAQPAIAPVVPQLPNGSIVGIWFGYNGDTLTLLGNAGIQAGKCINGSPGSPFGQVAMCNATAFFQAATAAINAGKLVPPALGTGKDGMPCPTVRDFTTVDQDQSDNVTSTYLVDGKGRTAQATPANMANLPNAKLALNGSDNGLVSRALGKALACTGWTAPDLADPNGGMISSQALNELHAMVFQKDPIALVPAGDPMVLRNGKMSLNKLNLYRQGVGQPMVQSLAEASTKDYCQKMLDNAPQRFMLDAQFTMPLPSPDVAAANNLFTFLAQRFVAAFDTELACTKLLRVKDPVQVKTDKNGVAISATINGQDPGAGGNDQPVTCQVNGTAVPGCTGTVTINGQDCSFMFNKMKNQVAVTCPAKKQ